jgi:tetratricopeptide (TPR) repeat protein
MACFALCIAVGCHSSSAGKGPEDASKPLSPQEAQAIVAEERTRLGFGQVEATAPTSLAEVLDILRKDESERFEKTRDYLIGAPGADALATRATLEMLWGEGLITMADLARDRAKQKDAEARSFEETLKLKPEDAGTKQRVESAKRQAERERRLRDALETLSRPHLETGGTLAREVIRLDPENPTGYAALANVYRLQGDWAEFETNMQKAEPKIPDRATVLYARAMEKEARLVSIQAARDDLEALMKAYPDLARAQAQLVRLETDAEARYAQLQKLKAINPRHLLIALEGSAIESEYKTAIELRGAQR